MFDNIPPLAYWTFFAELTQSFWRMESIYSMQCVVLMNGTLCRIIASPVRCVFLVYLAKWISGPDAFNTAYNYTRVSSPRFVSLPVPASQLILIPATPLKLIFIPSPLIKAHTRQSPHHGTHSLQFPYHGSNFPEPLPRIALSMTLTTAHKNCSPITTAHTPQSTFLGTHILHLPRLTFTTGVL